MNIREVADVEEAPAHIQVGTKVVLRCSACGSDAAHHVAYVQEKGVCVS
jgi:uncharacterized metal-binding protein YceD (DUF177 family)